ncbi:MAG: M48 family metalloprotease [Elainellaceae cyanobacterium]
MADFENPNALQSSHPEDGGRSHPTLESGLAALKQKDYDVAIAQLQQVAKTAKQRSTKLKAQMALVNAYERVGKVQQALAGCQSLQAVKSSQVQSWATQKLASLRQRYPDLEQSLVIPESSDPEPLFQEPSFPESSEPLAGDEAAPPVQQPSQTSSPDDFTGFQPFEGVPPPPESESEPESSDYSDTGFVPLNSTSAVAESGLSQAGKVEPLPSEGEETGFLPFDGSAIPASAPAHDLEQASFAAESSDPSEPSESAEAPDFENPFASLDDLAAKSSVGLPNGPPNGPANGTTNGTANGTATFNATGIQADIPANIPAETVNSSSVGGAAKRRPTRLSAAGSASPPQTPDRLANQPSERARKWKPLPQFRQLEFRLSYGWLAIALVMVLSLQIIIALETADPLWEWIDNYIYPPHIYFLEDHPVWVVLAGLLVLMGISPWLMRWILGQFYGVTSLSERELERRSPESLRLLKRVSKKEHFPMPKFHLLPTDAPAIFSYGHLPRTSRIVISRGILTQLSDDEMACLIAAELGHICQRDVIPMTLTVLVQQISFLLYWGVAQWGDRQRNGALRGIASGLAAAAYGLFWIIRLPSLWLSRTRQYQGDRYATSLTGNPNGQTRALLNLAVGMAQAMERQRLTDFRLEGLESLMAVSYRQALTLGSLHSKQQSLAQENVQAEAEQTSQAQAAQTKTSQAKTSSPEAMQLPPTVTLQPFLAWDVQNPHRRWLTINNTHPPLGDRLYQLAQYAAQWRIRPDLELSSRPGAKEATKPFWLQVIPYVAPALGIAVAIVLWLAGGIAGVVNIDALAWLWGDRSLLWGGVAIGASFGTLIRINSFFPDITTANAKAETALPELLQTVSPTPVDSVPVKWTGKLLGRDRIANGLNQDLMLRTAYGSIKLHFLSALGPLGNLVVGKNHPADFVGKTVTITGWFRRGATPWIDVETIKPERRAALRSGHPLWATLFAIAATLWGSYVIYKGSF